MGNLPRRMWDSCLILSYLSGGFTPQALTYDPQIKHTCELIIQQAERGELEIAMSSIAQIEVAYLEGYSDEDSEAKIKEFLSRDYVIPISVDITVVEEARRLVRKYRPGFKPPDAAHMAAALLNHIPALETTDPSFIRLDCKEGNPPLVIRYPLYEDTIPFPETHDRLIP